MKRIAHALLCLLLLVSPTWAAVARAEIYLVVGAASPVQSLTPKEALELYTGRARTFGNGGHAVLFDMPKASDERAEFYQVLTGMSLAQINSFWSRLMFSGQILPPQSLSDEAAMIEALRRNPNALGYMTSAPTDRNLRTVLVLKKPKP